MFLGVGAIHLTGMFPCSWELGKYALRGYSLVLRSWGNIPFRDVPLFLGVGS